MQQQNFYRDPFMRPTRDLRCEPNRSTIRRVLACSVCVAALAFSTAACSSGSGSDSLSSLSTNESAAIAPAGTSIAGGGKVATTAPSSTPPTMTVLSDEQAVRSVYGQFLAMIAVVADPPNPDHPSIAATTTGSLANRVRESLTSRRDSGRRSTGGYRSSIVSVQLSGDRAAVLDCSLDESVGFSATGERGVVDTQWFLRSSTVVRTASGWRVAEFVKGDPCVPAS